MNKLVCGADVCKDSIVCCFLEKRPKNIPEYFKENKHNFPKFYANMDGAIEFLAMKPTVLILEPTGTNYSWIWAELATQNDIKVLWVPHNVTMSYRVRYSLPAKNDQADALALALEGFLEPDLPENFLRFDHNNNSSYLRDLVLHHESLNRIKSPVVNRLRQQLAREFPEVALMQSMEAPDGEIPLWAWLAGIDRQLKRKSSYYDKKWQQSLGKFLGLEISQFTKDLALQLREIEHQQRKMEAEMSRELRSPTFEPYYRVLRRFGLCDKRCCFIIALIFPIEKFFGSGRMRAARGRFKQRLGLGKVEDSSGDSKKLKASGSFLARQFLYMHVYQTCTQDKPKSYTLEQDMVVDYYRYLLDRWNNDPVAIAERAKLSACRKVTSSLNDELKGMVDRDTIKKIKAAVIASVELDSMAKKPGVNQKKKWKKLVITRTAAKMCEYIWTALLDELYPKLDKSSK